MKLVNRELAPRAHDPQASGAWETTPCGTLGESCLEHQFGDKTGTNIYIIKCPIRVFIVLFTKDIIAAFIGTSSRTKWECLVAGWN